MNRHSLLVISALALASCQSSRISTPPRLVGDDLFVVNFHGRLATAPEPLQPEERQAKATDSLGAERQPIAKFASLAVGEWATGDVPVEVASNEASNDEVRVAVQVVSVPREWVRSTFGVRVRRQGPSKYGPKARAHNARLVSPAEQEPAPKPAPSNGVPMLSQLPVVSFLFRGGSTSMPVQWWGPRGMHVPAEEARAVFAELREKVERPLPRGHHFSHDLTFACQPDREARVAVARQVAFVESFEFEDRDNALKWEPGISTAETGFALQLTPKVDGDGLLIDYRLQARDVTSMPTANSRIAGSYRHGSNADTKGVTLQAPLFSDHVFEGQERCSNDDAFVLFATNATAEDEVILALFELQRGSSKNR